MKLSASLKKTPKIRHSPKIISSHGRDRAKILLNIDKFNNDENSYEAIAFEKAEGSEILSNEAYTKIAPTINLRYITAVSKLNLTFFKYLLSILVCLIL